MPIDPALKDYQAWLGYLQLDGLVVSPVAHVGLQVILPRDTIKLQEQFFGHIKESSNEGEEQRRRRYTTEKAMGFVMKYWQDS